MVVEDIRNAIKKRAETDDEWDFGVEKCWEEEIAILSENIDDTIFFFENECTADEFSWLSEIFEELIENQPDDRIIKILKKTAEKYPEECKKYNIMDFIDSAEARLHFLLDSGNKYK